VWHKNQYIHTHVGMIIGHVRQNCDLNDSGLFLKRLQAWSIM